MARHYIKDDEGEYVTDSDGNRQFWSDNDGDSNYETEQTTYTDRGGILGGGTTKNDGNTFNPEENRYNDD